MYRLGIKILFCYRGWRLIKVWIKYVKLSGVNKLKFKSFGYNGECSEGSTSWEFYFMRLDDGEDIE